MNAVSENAVLPARRRMARGPLAAALVVALAFGGVALVSATTTHRAGAATVRPHAIDAYMEFKMAVSGITGEDASTTPGDIEVNSFQWGVSKASTPTGGAGSGKVTFNPFSITRKIDSASPQFFKNCAAGTHFKSATLYVRKQGDTAHDYMTISFLNIVVSSVQWSASGVSGDEPVETVNMVPKSYTIVYTKGTPAGA